MKEIAYRFGPFDCASTEAFISTVFTKNWFKHEVRSGIFMYCFLYSMSIVPIMQQCGWKVIQDSLIWPKTGVLCLSSVVSSKDIIIVVGNGIPNLKQWKKMATYQAHASRKGLKRGKQRAGNQKSYTGTFFKKEAQLINSTSISADGKRVRSLWAVINSAPPSSAHSSWCSGLLWFKWFSSSLFHASFISQHIFWSYWKKYSGNFWKNYLKTFLNQPVWRGFWEDM